ncbi:MAG: hypothetical protein P1Q69_10925 [Candidatus Thorarchaeota archaeon]|nr:hypothetical protein [Candidatus Thorarchaeota archaeon]
MKLKDAVQLFEKELGTSTNTYEWYRKSAKKYGTVSFGHTSVSAFKKEGIWYVNEEEFLGAIQIHREYIEKGKKITEDHRRGIIHGSDGDTIETEWGGYRIRGPFRFEWSNYEVIRKKSSGRWICNSCNSAAQTEHKKEECHLCRDWNGCGNDCTLSRVFCSKCGHTFSI